jgi:Ca-activated chloride channel family protein
MTTRGSRTFSNRARLWLVLAWLTVGAGWLDPGCSGGGSAGSGSAEGGSLASLTAIRGTARVGETAIGALGRVAADETVAVESGGEAQGGGLARLVLDSGPSLLLDRGARASLLDASTVRLETGRALVEVADGEPLSLESAAGSIRLAAATISATASDRGLEVYVVRGEVAYVSGQERGIARAGERLTLAAGAAPSVSPETLFADWTGGLLTTGPGESFAPGMGVLEARVPDEIGQARWPLSIRRLDVSVSIVGELAVTEVEEEFFNPASETVEGLYRVRVPEGAVLQRFAVDRDGRMVDGFVREQAQARAAYEAQVYRGSTDDPALLEWDTAGSYRARIYPIAPGEVRRIAIRYAEWLRPAAEGQPRLYRFPMGEGGRAPHVQELSFVADVSRAEATDVRAGMGATVSPSASNPGRVELRRSDFRPRADFVLELTPRESAQHAYRAGHQAPRRVPGSRVIAGEADERDYFYLPLRLPEALYAGPTPPPAGLDVVIVADVSAGTDRAELELGRGVVEAIARRLGPDDRVSIVSSDLSIRGLVPAEGGAAPSATALGPATPARLDALLDGLARAPAGGATDLGAAIAQAAALLDPARQGAVIYVGDGAPTVGELGAEGLLAHLLGLPRPVRLYAVGVGRESNLDLLSTLARGGGLALRVEEREGAAEATLRILAHLSRPILQRVTVELGTGIDNAFPRVPVDVARGDVLDVVGRVRDGTPSSIVVRGLRRGEPFEETLAIDTLRTDEAADLRLRWANERLRQLLLGGASREEIAELGTRCGLITPYTSYYVPSAREMQSGMYGALQLERVPLLEPAWREAGPRPGETDTTFARAALTLALGPLALSGCTRMGSEPQGLAEDQREGVAVEALSPSPPAVVAAPAAPQASPTGVTPPPSGSTAPDPSEPGLGSSGDMAAASLEEQTAIGIPSTDGASSPASGGAPGLGAEGSGYGGGGLGRLGAAPQGMPPARARRLANARSRGGDRADGEAGELAALQEARRDQRTMTITTTVTTSSAHARRRCSDASRRSLEDRRALWAERLGQSDSVGSWVETYRQAGRDCEIGVGRDRRAFLEVMLDRAGSLARMVELYSYLPDASARGFFRSAILRRVRTADDLRLVRSVFGLGAGVDWSLVEQVLARARTPAERLRALRQLVAQTPGSFELRLRLLEELEVQGRAGEAARLAERLRADPLADPGVRTAIGELYLRLGLPDEARRTFSEIVEFQPLDELARRRLGDLYRAHGWYEDAYRQYETLVSIRPDDPTALLLLAQAAAGAGRIDEALRLEQRVMETSEQGAVEGIARTAMLWSSVRFAELRKGARERGAQADLDALLVRMRRGGVLRNARALRVSLVWAHPDANISLWTAHPGLSLSRPDDLYSELGIEAFDLPEQEPSAYRVEVRRDVRDRLGTVEARLVLVWNEGQSDEQIEVVPLTFDPEHRAYAWTLTGRDFTPVAPSDEALRTSDDAPSLRTARLPTNRGVR